MKKIMIIIMFLLLPAAILVAEDIKKDEYVEWTMSTGIGQTYGGIHGFNIAYRYNRISTGLSIGMVSYDEPQVGWAWPTKIYFYKTSPSSPYFCFGPGTILLHDDTLGLFVLFGFEGQIKESRWFIDANIGMGITRGKATPEASVGIRTYVEWMPVLLEF